MASEPDSRPPAQNPLSRNRFARYPKTTLFLTVVAILALIELAAYAVIAFKGHGGLRFQYRYNRILSGYTVFQNVPHHSFRTSAIKVAPSEPDPVLDEHGFLSDGPVALEKPAGAFRIFLVGGSTAFGAGQNVRYHAVHSYPDGVYAYPSSIAGQLKAALERLKPGQRYEVINAAGFERRIHQSFLQYVQSLTRFHPDLIINLDGMNDVYSIATGTPFEDVEAQLPFYANLYERRHSPLNYSATYYVLSTAFEKWQNARRSAEPAPAENQPGKTAPATPASAAADPVRIAYDKQKARFETNSQRLLQIIRQYFAVLKADKMRCLFVLQPLLNRKGVNKRLSEIEQKLTTVIVPSSAVATMPIDESALILMYFEDESFSPAVRAAAASAGVPYLDMNEEIRNLGPEVEFYTDYCHLTPDANRRVAEILARAIVNPPAVKQADFPQSRASAAGR